MNRRYCSNRQRGERHDPRRQIESGRRRCSQNRSAILFDKVRFDVIVALALIDQLAQFREHRAGTRTMEVIARAQKLIAGANANEVPAERPNPVITIHGQRQRSRGEDEEKCELTKPSLQHSWPPLWTLVRAAFWLVFSCSATTR